MKVIVSAAVSADGYLDDLSPKRLMLSSPEDWAEVFRLRAACDAILVGAGTLRKDNPALVIRDEALRAERRARGAEADILKVTVSRSGDLSPDLRFFTEGVGEKVVFLPEDVDPKKRAALERVAAVIAVPEISAAAVVDGLVRRGVSTLLVEGGEQVLGLFFGAGIVDEFRLAVAPFFVGQPGAPRLLPGGSYPFGVGVDSPRRMTLHEVRRLGDMTVIHYLLEKQSVSDDPNISQEDLKYLHAAIEASRQSLPSDAAYRVGAVIVTPEGHTFTGYTHETASDNHAEEEVIQKALSAGATLRGATIYTSMEPCSVRRSKPKPCCELIVEHGFARVVFALYEPPSLALCYGAGLLRGAGIRVDVAGFLAPAVREINRHIF